LFQTQGLQEESNNFQGQKKKSSPRRVSTKKRSKSPGLQKKGKQMEKRAKAKDTKEEEFKKLLEKGPPTNQESKLLGKYCTAEFLVEISVEDLD
jgi:hypothetical protein